MRYYLVSYAYSQGFGNMFFKCNHHLNIPDAERELSVKAGGNAIIIAINEIEKSQYDEAPNPKKEDK